MEHDSDPLANLARTLAVSVQPGEMPNWADALTSIEELAGCRGLDLLLAEGQGPWHVIATTAGCGHAVDPRDKRESLPHGSTGLADIGGLRVALRAADVERDAMRATRVLAAAASLLGRLAAIPLREASLELERRNRATLLDQLAPAIFIVRSTRRIAFANAAAQSLLRQRRFLLATAGTLHVARTGASGALVRLVSSACRPDAGEPSTLALTDADGAVLMVAAVPLSSDASDSLVADGWCALLATRIPQPPSCPDPAVSELLGLTAAERRVFEAAASGLGIPEIATRLDLGQPTVKTHLSRVFRKAGIASQAALVRLAADWKSPLLTG